MNRSADPHDSTSILEALPGKFDIKIHSASIVFISIWASSQENLSKGVCENHRRRPACASAQSDQHLCYSLLGKYHI